MLNFNQFVEGSNMSGEGKKERSRYEKGTASTVVRFTWIDELEESDPLWAMPEKDLSTEENFTEWRRLKGIDIYGDPLTEEEQKELDDAAAKRASEKNDPPPPPPTLEP